MIKRLIAFVLDVFALTTISVLLFPLFPQDSTFGIAAIQYLLLVAVLVAQFLVFDRTLGLAIVGLKLIFVDSNTSKLRILWAIFPVVCFYSLSLIEALEYSLNEQLPSDIWTMSQRVEPQHQETQVSFLIYLILGTWIIFAVAPFWLGKGRTGWELLGRFKIGSSSKS